MSQPSSPATPTSTPTPTAGTSDNGMSDDGSDIGIVNYYFLLIVIALVIAALLYWVWIRRRRRRNAHQPGTGSGSGHTRDPGYHRASARLQTMGWPTRGHGSGRHGRHSLEEGLDELGQAPPPYVPGQPPPVVYTEHGRSIPLHDMPHDTGKPPEYERAASFHEDIDMTRPVPVHIPVNRPDDRLADVSGTRE
ncbi:hypothetical protein MMC09_005723 [Bachmanniomyces sp. S44760]|nr:hypothetical protein [Bachmanniomyces sp. S44760]